MPENQPPRPNGPADAPLSAAAAADAVVAGDLAEAAVTEAARRPISFVPIWSVSRIWPCEPMPTWRTIANASPARWTTNAATARCRLLRDLLPVVDNLTRAIEASEKASDSGSLLQGVKMVARQLDGVLAQHQCQRIEALHQPFDPARHQAIMQQPSADHPPATVILVAQDGYTLYDRVVRPSQVIVSTRPPETEPAA